MSKSTNGKPSSAFNLRKRPTIFCGHPLGLGCVLHFWEEVKCSISQLLAGSVAKEVCSHCSVFWPGNLGFDGVPWRQTTARRENGMGSGCSICSVLPTSLARDLSGGQYSTRKSFSRCTSSIMRPDSEPMLPQRIPGATIQERGAVCHDHGMVEKRGCCQLANAGEALWPSFCSPMVVR